MVVQVHLQGIYSAQMKVFFDLAPGIGQHHVQAGVVGRQLEPQAASSQHLRVDLNGGAAHAQFFVTKLGQRRRAQAQLHAVQTGDRLGLHKQEPDHHALYIFKLNIKGRVHQHRALHPFSAQMQKPNVPEVRKIHLG